MDKIESFKRDKAYIKYKLTVKNWEKDFKIKYSRTPSKFDIKEAPSSIKYAYKKYFQLKSNALEDSLSVCDLDSEVFGSPDQERDCVLSPQSDLPADNNVTDHHHRPSLPSGSEIEKLLSQVPSKETKKCPTPISPFTTNLSKKLFESKKFSIRNPRKLSVGLSKSEQSFEDKKIFDAIEFCSQPKNECIDEQTFGEFSLSNSNVSLSNVLDNSQDVSNCSFSGTASHFHTQQKTPSRNINTAWLQRAIGEKNSEDKIEVRQDCQEQSDGKFGLANIRISIDNVKDEKNIDYVENSESESDDPLINKLKPALKKRKLTKTSDDSLVMNEEPCSTTVTNKDKHKKPLKQNNSRRKRKSPKKIIHQNIEQEYPPDIADFVPFNLESDLKPRLSKPEEFSNVKPMVKIKNKENNKEIDNLEKKIASGTLNENFVRINIEKKVFVRGKKSINFSKYKKQQWKDKKALHAGMEFPEGGKIACFKCGANGHMARYCTAHRGDSLLPLQDVDECEIPTLEDMQNIVSKETEQSKASITEQLSVSAFTPSQIPDSFMKLLAKTPLDTEVKPIYGSYPQETSTELHETLQKFGHDSFKPGQEEAILRILCGMSTLLILSTGGGKSLCYQLPAYIYSQHYKCITLVISPLVSLMEDQVLSMPDFLKAGCLHTNQPPTQRKKIVECLKNGEINVLLISPEALVSDGSQGFNGLFKSLPQIAFACIDEAHCVSQWSHNFRPSYLMICRVLREKLNVKCILGLTATASQPTIKSIIDHINIPDGLAGVITNPTLPNNLCLAVSLETNKDRALVSLLNSERVCAFASIIVYCIRRDECERVAAILRSCLQEPGQKNMEKPNNKRKRMSYIAEAYHAGMSAAQRKKIQKHFMDGTLRIIVATVAFGMGINKADIRCIIHYNMPSSFESYVQEVGRAGRDGKYAYCHVFLNNDNNDKSELLKHIHANTIDRTAIRKLLQKVFIPCQCAEVGSSSSTAINFRCKGHEVGIPIDSTVEELDLPSENIATMLCYVELHPKRYVKVLNNAYMMCKISSYGGPEKILQAAKNSPPLAMAYLIESKRNPAIINNNIMEFDVIEVASAIGWESGLTKYHLKNLEWTTSGGSSQRSQLKVEFNTLGFKIKAPGDLSETELDAVLDDLHGMVLSQEKAMLYQLEESYKAFSYLGNWSVVNSNLADDTLNKMSNELKNVIRNYFQRESNISADIALEDRPLEVENVAQDVRALICAYKDCTFTGRSIARIFQGISSPNYPAIIWGRCKFWRSHIHEDFYGILRVATQQLILMKNV